MTKQFPHKCCRCGFCCMSGTCPVGIVYYNIQGNQPCPSFKYDTTTMEATCELAYLGIIGIGKGCCISARCFKDGVQYDFASLPEEIKKGVALSVWRKKHDKG